MNWTKDDNLATYGIVMTPQTKKIPLGNKNEEYQIYKIPLEKLKYNSNNGRIFMEINRLKSDVDIKSLEDNDVEEYNNEIENLIWESSEDRNKDTKEDIRRYTQLEAGVILSDGTVIDGNRRFTCLRKLHKEEPDNPNFKYFNAAILFMDDSQISRKDIKSYELRVQFGKDEQVDYKPVNFAMSIYQEIKTGTFTIQEIADNVRKRPNEIVSIVQTCELVEEFLEYIKQAKQLSIAEELNIFWPLQNLASYLNRDGNNLSELEIIRRKHLYFDYLLTIDIALPTQEFRDNLLKKIFKDQALLRELSTEYSSNYGADVKNTLIDSEIPASDFVDAVKQYRTTENASNIKASYKKAVDKKNMETMVNAPVQLSDEVLERTKKINIDPFIVANSSTADDKLRKVKQKLSETKCIIEDLIKRIDEKIE